MPAGIDYYPATAVADRIRTLLEAGWTRREIATRLNIALRTLHAILTGRSHDTTPYIARALFDLDAKDLPDRILPTGSMRRIQGLAAIGWTVSQLARDTGLHVQFLRNVAAGRYRRIPRAKAAAVTRICRELYLTPGPSKAARTVAARNGWLPITVWEDPDDPACQPDIEQHTAGVAS